MTTTLLEPAEGGEWQYKLFHDQSPQKYGTMPGLNLRSLDLQSDSLPTVLGSLVYWPLALILFIINTSHVYMNTYVWKVQSMALQNIKYTKGYKWMDWRTHGQHENITVKPVFSGHSKIDKTRAEVDGTPSQIPAFWPIAFTLGSRTHKMLLSTFNIIWPMHL